MASQQAAGGGAVPAVSIDARRMVLIGLGTSGARVCNQVMERLEWNFGSPANVPWLRAVILETAEAPAQYLIRSHAMFIHIKIDAASLGALRNDPEAYRAKLDLPAWQMKDLYKGVDAIDDGAKNIRYFGRLAFFHPTNFHRIKNAIVGARDALMSLGAVGATNAFKNATNRPVQVDLGSNVHVYVVGTLCGGTASGCFIDLGYLLQHMDEGMARTAILMLPSPGHQNPREKANALAGLRELNHFSSDSSRYRCQYPDLPGIPKEFPTGRRPFQHQYLVQTRDGDPKREYARLVTAVADYVYADLIGCSAGIRDANRTNIAEYFERPDYEGATQKFYTFGVAVIEYPYAKVAKACHLRLIKRGMEDLAGGGIAKHSRAHAVNTRVPLIRRRDLEERLFQHNTTSLLNAIRDHIEQSRSQARARDDAMALLVEHLTMAFDGKGQAQHESLPKNIVPLTIEQNARPSEEELRKQISAAATEYLREGVQSAADFLDELDTQLQERVSQCKKADDQTNKHLKADADAARDRAAECRGDWALLLTGARNQAVDLYVSEFLRLLSEYAEQRLRACAAPTVATVYDNTSRWIKKIKERLHDPVYGLTAQIYAYRAAISDAERDVNVLASAADDPWRRSASGLELFDTGTVDREYRQCLLSVPGVQTMGGDLGSIEKTLARNALEKYLEASIADLLKSETEIGRFDVGMSAEGHHITERDVLELANPARQYFLDLRNRDVFAHLFARSDAQTQIHSVLAKSSILLDWNDGSPRYDASNEEKKHQKLVFYDQSSKGCGQFDAVLASPTVDAPSTISWVDGFQILFLQERGAFSLATIRSLESKDTPWYTAYQLEGPEKLVSRGDIAEWVGWEAAQERDRRRVRNAFLVAVALGKVEKVSATRYRFTYRPVSPVDRGDVDFSHDLYEVAETARSRDELLPAMELCISDWRRSNTDAEFVNRLSSFVRGTDDPHTRDFPGIDSHFKEGSRSLTTQDIWAYLLGYIMEDSGLKAAYRGTEWGQSWLDQFDSLRRPEDTEWFYCPNCGAKLGRQPEDLYVLDKNTNKRVPARCVACKHSLTIPMLTR